MNDLLEEMYESKLLMNFYIASLISSDKLLTKEDYESSLAKVNDLEQFLKTKTLDKDVQYYLDKVKDCKEILQKEMKEL